MHPHLENDSLIIIIYLTQVSDLEIKQSEHKPLVRQAACRFQLSAL